MRYPSMWGIAKFVIYIYSLSRGNYSTAPELYLCLYLYVYASYNGVCIFIFVYVIQSNCWIYFILVFCSISLMCMGYFTTASLLKMCLYHFFVNIISIVTAIGLCTSYHMLVGCAKYWAFCHAYLLYTIGHSIVVILVDLHSQKWINRYFFK